MDKSTRILIHLNFNVDALFAASWPSIVSGGGLLVKMVEDERMNL